VPGVQTGREVLRPQIDRSLLVHVLFLSLLGLLHLRAHHDHA
jgi:hypothetical protein